MRPFEHTVRALEGHKLFVLRFTNKLNWQFLSLWRKSTRSAIMALRDNIAVNQGKKRDITWTVKKEMLRSWLKRR